MRLITYKEDKYLIFVFLMISVSILFASYFSFDGYLSPDSTNYLSVAQNLINGNGYVIPSDRRQPFAVWPIGYPTLIATTSFFSGLSVFWSSKILNIILIGLIFLVLRKYYKNNTYLVSIVFTWSSYMVLFFYTWSETVFIFSLILFSVSIYEFIKNKNPNILNYIIILASILLLFFSRYIGAFSFGLVGLFGLYYTYQKEYLKGFKLIIIALLSIAIMVLYLYINYSLTGFQTGMPRIESPESNFQLLYMLIKAFIYELIIPVNSGGLKALAIFLVQILIFLIMFKKYGINRNKLENSENYLLEKIFFTIGIAYLFFIILMRWLSYFDGYSYRLLGPGTILIFIAFLGYLVKSKIIFDNKWIKLFLITFSSISILINSIYFTIKKYNDGTYKETISKFEYQLRNIPTNSIIVFPDKHLNYMRLDLNYATPFYKPYFKKQESIDEFLKRLDCKKNIFIDTSYKKIDLNGRFHSTVIDFFNALPKNQRFHEYKCP